MVNKSAAPIRGDTLILRDMRGLMLTLFFVTSFSILGQEPASQDSLLPIVLYTSDGNARHWLSGNDKSSLQKFTAAPVPIQPTVIYSEKSGVDLSTTAQQQLNDVVEKLAPNGKKGIFITGYSDRNGNSEKNWKESEKRAKAVRNFIVNSGSEPSRCVAKFTGDIGSIGKNPGDRKVIVEFIARP